MNTYKLTFRQQLEPFLIDALAITIAFIPSRIQLPDLGWALVFLLTILYATHYSNKATKSSSGQLLHGISLMGAMFGSFGIGMLLGDGFLMAVIGPIIILPFLFLYGMGTKKKKKKKGWFTKIYEHPSRIMIVPIVFSLFYQGIDLILTEKLEPRWAIVVLFMAVLPIRFAINNDQPQKGYHYLALVGALLFYIHDCQKLINNSPSTPIWALLGEQSQSDKLLFLEKTDSLYLSEVHTAGGYNSYFSSSGGTYYIFTKRNSANVWEIDFEQTKRYYQENSSTLDKADFNDLLCEYRKCPQIGLYKKCKCLTEEEGL